MHNSVINFGIWLSGLFSTHNSNFVSILPMLWVNDQRVVFQFVVQGSGKCRGGLWGPSRIL